MYNGKKEELVLSLLSELCPELDAISVDASNTLLVCLIPSTNYYLLLF